MSKSFVVFLAGASITAWCAGAAADTLPKAGSFSWHTGWKAAGSPPFTVADKQMMGSGGVTGVTFNDKGAGPLHGGPANCFDAWYMVDGRGKDKGFCTFSDADGDRIVTEFTGDLSAEGGTGTNVIVGGTGKYSGITGSGPWKCKWAGGNGELACNQRLDYKLP